MTNTLDPNDFPADNSHFPVTLKPGDRTGWWGQTGWRGSNPDQPVFRATPANLLALIDSPGHTPKLVIGGIDRWHRPAPITLTCSCGHESVSNVITKSGTWSKNAPRVWNAHKDTLAAPVLVWESKATRARYKCYVSTAQQAKDMLGVDRVWYKHFMQVVITSTHGPNRVRSAVPGLEDAVQSAEQLGRQEEGNGRDVIWHREPAVVDVSTSVADLLLAIQRQADSDDLRTLIAARKLTDEFLHYAEPITDLRRQIEERIDSLIVGDLFDD